MYLEDEQIILTKLNYEVQLRRRNDGGECRVFSQFERGACPKIPRGFGVQACPETPHHYWRSQSQPHNLFKFGQIKGVHPALRLDTPKTLSSRSAGWTPIFDRQYIADPVERQWEILKLYRVERRAWEAT